MRPILSKLEPASVWRWFEEVLRIPRPSGHEERIADFLESFAVQRSLRVSRDRLNNVCIKRNGSGESASHPGIVLQAHVDIVAEKCESSRHDFLTDPIEPKIEGDWVRAVSTTLGADNGMGVALMLALLDSDDLDLPPLECLFTVDEERGLVGASGFPTDWITFSRLINLDSESDSCVCIGCAGGLDIRIEGKLERESVPPENSYRLAVSGLTGGHSGLEIAMNRANAIRLLGRCLDSLMRLEDVRIVSLHGGSRRNAIPRSADAVLTIPVMVERRAFVMMDELEGEFTREYAGIEENISIGLSRCESDQPPMTYSHSHSRRLVNLLMALPHGVEKMSGTVQSLVETSDNLAILSLDGDRAMLTVSVRSSIESAKIALAERVCAITALAGYSCDLSGGYPGWTPDPDSALLAECKGVYRDINGSDPAVGAVHAGLECGIIGSRIGDLDMISLGPDIRDVHVPGERVSIPSVARFWKFLTMLLERLD
jgi:dipeptidase D